MQTNIYSTLSWYDDDGEEEAVYEKSNKNNKILMCTYGSCFEICSMTIKWIPNCGEVLKTNLKMLKLFLKYRNKQIGSAIIIYQ